ncbi:methyltransferase [Kurthia zopfii]|uniref:Ribosomal RNA large subunit methyltransferase I n=1 Tax=Kurthia zopfii TaxID=1650 RepID=A0A2U3AC49_9BACL|nr:class I SAM-dependent rRNA methyltransferase [Kurthia zopfii]PWI22102.1 RlmI/RlmK family 23S rRNA methyltransferase [Kurthia zopfii]TDR37797.1 SAM-dependent methyltransferase [Kurthia zopfii]STX08473.1 Ribosomal RNA large subunit methyltransferase I [Kurthia zopfii]VEI05279.1 Ribosomal RNA large subunit methyltransferase I [Kurthia zopfii]GEK30896.1 methyltransferase [Kurthia zopfii]
MKTLRVKPEFIADFKRGYSLVHRDSVSNQDLLEEEGELFEIVDQHNKLLGTAYYGIQNKGIGWILSTKDGEEIDQEYFINKIKAALRHRESFFNDSMTTAFRVFNGEGDGIGGLAIDYFDGYFMISWYSDGIYQYKDYVIHALDTLTSYRAIYEKKRFDTKGMYIDQDDFVKGTEGDFPIIIKENGMNFAIDLNDGAMTGIFLDQRDVRQTIRDHYSEGKNVLNTFSYTGAFSVAAALGGATETTSVDLAKRSLPKTIEQFSVNSIDFEAQDIKVMDVFQYFKYAQRHALKFDLVVLDPPSFARSKKMTFSTAKDYPKLLEDAIAITAKKGIIVASTNNASFGMKKFKTFIDKAFKDTNTKYKIVEDFGLPKDFRANRDFPEFNYLKVCFIQKLN